MVVLAARGGLRAWSPVTTGFFLALVMCGAYSSFGTKSTAAYVPWLLAALAPTLLPRKKRTVEDYTQAWADEPRVLSVAR